MSMIPNFFGRPWDPFEGWPMPMMDLGFPSETASFARAAVDQRETPSAYVFTVEMPGLKKEEVRVKVDDGVLHISGERRRHKEDSADGWYHMESSSCNFSRRFRLPENAKADQLKASINGGVLTVTVPKAEKSRRAKVRSIEISDH